MKCSLFCGAKEGLGRVRNRESRCLLACVLQRGGRLRGERRRKRINVLYMLCFASSSSVGILHTYTHIVFCTKNAKRAVAAYAGSHPPYYFVKPSLKTTSLSLSLPEETIRAREKRKKARQGEEERGKNR